MNKNIIVIFLIFHKLQKLYCNFYYIFSPCTVKSTYRLSEHTLLIIYRSMKNSCLESIFRDSLQLYSIAAHLISKNVYEQSE